MISEIMGLMEELQIHPDAFSHGQVKSKIWLAQSLQPWMEKNGLDPQAGNWAMHWYGSWVGIGPLVLLLNSRVKFKAVHLYDLEEKSLATSKKILDYWYCEQIAINTHCVDVSRAVMHRPQDEQHLFINTACEHILSNSWLIRIPEKSFVLLQSTDLELPEHINRPQDMNHFITKYSPLVDVLESATIEISYPNKSFRRFMLFGRKK